MWAPPRSGAWFSATTTNSPRRQQLEQMKALVRQAMREGAVGVSTSLEYAPAPYAKTEELIALAVGGIEIRRHLCHAHAQRERRGSRRRLTRRCASGAKGHLPVEIWHLKVAGKANWGRMPEVVAKINAARPQGMDVTADTYAYTAWFNRFFRLHSRLGARWRRRQDDRASQGSGDARPHPQRHDHPSKDWDNEWQEIPGPEAILIGVVQNPKLLPLQGKTPGRSGEDVEQRSDGRAVRFADRRQRRHRSRRLRHVGAGRRAGLAAAVGLLRQRFVGHVAGRNSGPGTSASRAPMAPFRAFFANMFAKKRN